MIGFLFRYVSNCVRIFSPFFTTKGRGFAFIVHPRDYNDVVANLPFLKFVPKGLVIRFFSLLHPFTVSKITGLKSLRDKAASMGWVIGVPMFAHQMMEDRLLARKKITQAIRLARKRGATVIGLGGLTGSIMEGGAGLSKNDGVIITAGRAYTTFVVKSYADHAINRLGLLKESLTVAVVGAAGGVGSAITKLLVKEPFRKIILVDLERKVKRLLEDVKGTGLDKVEITHQIGLVKEADLIITVTNAPEAVVGPDDIKSGAIIIDDAQPSDISPEVIKTRDDIIIIEAGVISADDNIKVGTKMRLANKNEIYCCLGEVMALAASGQCVEYKPNNVTQEAVDRIAALAGELGFKLAPYQFFGRMVEPDRIEKVRMIHKNNFVIND